MKKKIESRKKKTGGRGEEGESRNMEGRMSLSTRKCGNVESKEKEKKDEKKKKKKLCKRIKRKLKYREGGREGVSEFEGETRAVYMIRNKESRDHGKR